MMKIMKTTITVIAAVLLSTFAYASGKVRLNMKPAGNESAFVEILKSSETKVEVDVKNELNEVVFYKKLNDPTAVYQRKYNFSGLEDGRYLMSVYSGNEINEAWFKIEGGEVLVENNRKVMEPHVKNGANTWKISFLNFPMEPMNLYVYDGSYLLYHKKIEPVFAVHEGLDLSELLPGDYQIIFSNQHNNYEYEISVN